MAIKTATSTTFIDDLDGTTDPSVKTRRFAFDVEMELSDTNAAKIHAAIASILGSGRDMKKVPAVAKGGRPDRARNKRIKEWAATPGNWDSPVPRSGRFSKKLLTAYAAATGDVG